MKLVNPDKRICCKMLCFPCSVSEVNISICTINNKSSRSLPLFRHKEIKVSSGWFMEINHLKLQGNSKGERGLDFFFIISTRFLVTFSYHKEKILRENKYDMYVFLCQYSRYVARKSLLWDLGFPAINFVIY